MGGKTESSREERETRGMEKERHEYETCSQEWKKLRKEPIIIRREKERRKKEEEGTREETETDLEE